MVNHNHIQGFIEFILRQRRAGSTKLALRALETSGKGIIIVPDRSIKQMVIQMSRKKIAAKTIQEIAENSGTITLTTPYILDNSTVELLADMASRYYVSAEENKRLRQEKEDLKEELARAIKNVNNLHSTVEPYLPFITFLNKIFHRKIK